MLEKKKHVVSRRDMLKLSVESFLAFLAVGTVSVATARADYVRPPGALSPDKFTSTCMRCGACEEVCPTKAIQLVDISRDLINTGTSHIDYRYGGCTAWKTTCLRCVQACPTNALAPQDPIKPIGVARVRQKECVNCMACFQWCPIEGAVRFPNPHGGSFIHKDDIPTELKLRDSPYKPWVDTEKCVGCGLCAHYCIVPCIDLLPRERG
jgi:ferredoxin-type protein NapG